MPLSDNSCKKAAATDKPRKLADSGGLFLYVTPSGAKLWRLDYRFGTKRRTLALGAYPDVSLRRAREKRDEARRLLADGIDPGEHRRAAKAERAERATNSFEAVAREWFAKFSPRWAESHSSKIIRRLERDVFPWLGRRPIAELTPPEILAAMRRIESRGTLETAHRVLQSIGQICRYAVATGRLTSDPTRDLRGALPPVRESHFPAFTDPLKVGELLRALDAFKGSFQVACALRLAPLLFVRPGELRKARWADIDWDAQEWRYTASKTGTPHVVPLAPQALEILRELHPLTGHGEYVFPGRDKRKPMSDAALNAALRRLGFDTRNEITGHGFRAVARTLLDERLKFPAHIIEAQLAHSVKDPLGRAYNRTAFIAERHEMMAAWANFLDKLKSGAEIVPLRKGAA